MQPESGQIVYAGSNFLHLIRLHSSKEGPRHIVQNRPGSNPDGLVRFGPNASGLAASQYAKFSGPSSSRMQLGPLPISHFQTRFLSSTDSLDHSVQNQLAADLVLTDCVWFWPNGSSLEASRCARITGPASCQLF